MSGRTGRRSLRVKQFKAFSECVWSFSAGFEGVFFLRKMTLECIAPVYSNSENAIAGQVRMDLEPGRTRVHEHAETGRPLRPGNRRLLQRGADGLAEFERYCLRGET
jgi:hypothetical protein